MSPTVTRMPSKTQRLFPGPNLFQSRKQKNQKNTYLDYTESASTLDRSSYKLAFRSDDLFFIWNFHHVDIYSLLVLFLLSPLLFPLLIPLAFLSPFLSAIYPNSPHCSAVYFLISASLLRPGVTAKLPSCRVPYHIHISC